MTKLITPLMMACVLALVGNATAQESASCCAAKSTESAACCKTAADDPHADHAAEPNSAQTPPSCCAGGHGTGMQHGKTAGGAHGGQGRGAVMPDAMSLLHNHTALQRTVEEIPNGVKTVSTTTDPELLAVLRRHPREMYAFYEAGGSVRPHDPMFAELARVADKVHMEFRDIENGVETIATSDDPEVVKLIRAHAAKVTEFVKRGHGALHEGAPLPEDYKPNH